MRHLTTIVAILLVSSSAAVAQAQEQKRPDTEVVQDKTAKPVFSGASVNIIRNLKSQEYSIEREAPHNDSCCRPPWDIILAQAQTTPQPVQPSPQPPIRTGTDIIRQKQLAPLPQPLPRFPFLQDSPCVDWPGGCKPPDLKSVR
jgi:hypothetical protein